MRIYLVRHGIAEEPSFAMQRGRSEEERKLTAQGLSETALVAAAFHKKVPAIDRLFHSPYTRARETADFFHRVYGVESEECDEFRPEDDPLKGAKFLLGVKGAAHLMVVTHEPYVSALASYLITGDYRMPLGFERAAIAGLEWADGKAQLLFMLPPRVLLAT